MAVWKISLGLKYFILFLNLMQVGSIHLRLMFNEMIWVHDELKHGKLTGTSGSRQIVKTWFTSTTVTPFYPGFTGALATIWLTNWTVGSQGMTVTIYIGGEIKNKNFNNSWCWVSLIFSSVVAMITFSRIIPEPVNYESNVSINSIKSLCQGTEKRKIGKRGFTLYSK